MPIGEAVIAQTLRPFNTAFSRIAGASNIETIHDELSTALHHAYRLMDAVKEQMGDRAFFAMIGSGSPREIIAAVRWARNADTHDLVRVAALGDAFSDYWTDLWGAAVWEADLSMPSEHGEKAAYERTLASRPVLDTLRRAMDELVEIARALDSDEGAQFL